MTEQPPILGRPTTPEPGGDPHPAPTSDPAPASWQPDAGSEERRATRRTLLLTGGVALAALAVCNGVLLWVYDNSTLGVVITLGTFVAAVSLAWLRNKGRQLTVIVVGLQALMAASIVVGALVAAASDVPTGILAGGITLVGLVLLSVIGFVFATGERTQRRTAVAAGTAVAVALSMAGAYALLMHDPERARREAPFVAPAEDSVFFLVKRGQDYQNDGAAPAAAERAFEKYVCPSASETIAALFAGLVRPGEQRLADPEDVIVTERGKKGETATATVTATIYVIDDIEGTELQGPETWTFHLEKTPGDNYWKVCSIDRPT
ncbi:MAG: hypothetical protein ACRDT6_16770 [Micromonosporaceae bacterium]